MDSVRDAKFAMTAGGRFGISTSGSHGLNLNLRKGFVARSGWRSEVGWTDALGLAVWLFDPANPFRTGAPASERFDLANIDEHHNAKRLWNLVADWPRLSSAQQASLTALPPTFEPAHWDGACSCVLDAVWDEFSEKRCARTGRDGNLGDRVLRRVGQVPGRPPQSGSGCSSTDRPRRDSVRQLGARVSGCWSNLGRWSKVLDAPITLFVIIVATGCLAEFISKGTVNFAQSRRALERVGRLLSPLGSLASTSSTPGNPNIPLWSRLEPSRVSKLCDVNGLECHTFVTAIGAR